jgi:hypothetical protein
LRAGENQICIPVIAIKQAPADRVLDITNIAAVWMFVANLPDSLAIYFDNIRLE